MVPQTVAAVLLFALLVLPGITFELLRQTRRPGFDQTPLEEFARVIVASIAFASVAATILALVSIVWPRIVIQVSMLASHGSGWYWRFHPGLVISTVVLEVLLATVVALAVHRSLNQPDGRGLATRAFKGVIHLLGHRPGEQVERFTVWRTLFREWRPAGCSTRVAILKTDGTLITGTLGGYDTSGSHDSRDVALTQPIDVIRPGWATPRQPGVAWQFLIVPGREISEVFVTWPPSTNDRTASD